MTFLDVEIEKCSKDLEKQEGRSRQLQEKISETVSVPTQRLQELKRSISVLDLAKDIHFWKENRDELENSLSNDARRCLELGQILSRHPPCKLSTEIFEKEYLPFYKYLQANFLSLFRKSLRRMKYPSKEATTTLLDEISTFSEDDITQASSSFFWSTRLQIGHSKIIAEIKKSAISDGETFFSIIEICRPIVERVSFHFLEESSEKISSSRIDRLPQWLLKYIRENVLEGGALRILEEFANLLGDERVIFQFLNEICELVNFVLVKREFFRHQKIVGPNSNPEFLCAAAEQLFTFDSYVRNLVKLNLYPKSLSQFHLVEDEELWKWFLECQRKWAISTLFDTQLTPGTAPYRISPRAELFSALINSIQCKAAVLENPSELIANVGVNLCQDFLDAVHESSKDLRAVLIQGKSIDDKKLHRDVESWIELINGTHMAAFKLNKNTNQNIGNGDLTRVGRSIYNLRDALVDECVTILINNVVMEQAKFASYIMRCSYMLSSNDSLVVDDDLSQDLHETALAFSVIMKLCPDCMTSEKEGELDFIRSFAPTTIKTTFLERIANELLEIALDTHGMIPDIIVEGANVFCRDVFALFGETNLPPLAMRLLDVTKFMSANSKTFQEIKRAFFGLVCLDPSCVESLHIEAFTNDGTVHDEAILMMRAKGFNWMYLEDMISILNRRR